MSEHVDIIKQIVHEYQAKAVEVVNSSRLPDSVKTELVEEILNYYFNDEVVIEDVVSDLATACTEGVLVKSFELFIEESTLYEYLRDRLVEEEMREELARVASNLDELAMKMYVEVCRAVAPRLNLEVRIPGEVGWIVRIERKL